MILKILIKSYSLPENVFKRKICYHFKLHILRCAGAQSTEIEIAYKLNKIKTDSI